MEAIMKIDTPLHTDHQLDQLAGQFAHWRQTRSHPSERIPQAPLGPGGRARPGAALQPRGAAVAGLAQRPQKADGHAACVPPAAAPTPPPLSKCRLHPRLAPGDQRTMEIELQRADGARLRTAMLRVDLACGGGGAGLFGGGADAATHPAKPHLCGHRARRFPQGHRWPRGRVPPTPRRQPPGGRRLRLSQPRGHGTETLAL